MTASSINGFLSSLGEAADLFNFHIKTVDKKEERLLHTFHSKALRKQIEDSASPIEQRFHSLVLYLCFVHFAALLHSPTKAIPALLSRLGEKMDKEKCDLLCSFNALVLKKVLEKNGEKKKEYDESMGGLWPGLLSLIQDA